MLTRVVFGNDFTIRIDVVQPQYTIDGTIYEDFDITKCSDVKVCLICEQHKVVIPLSWTIEENTNNIILADIIGKQLHIGSVYGVQITGLDENNKAWRYKNRSVFSVVDATKDSLMDVELMNEPLELRTEISLFVNAIPIEGHQGPAGQQGERGEKGEDGQPGPQGPAGQQGERGEKGEKGEKGETGQQGPQGDKGQDGTISFDELTPEQKEELRGPQGQAGQQGPAGQQGEKGDKGQDGTISFDELTPAQKEELRGPRGFQGEQGQAGQQGEKGEKGEKGETGQQGPQGEKGQDGQPGVQGSQGEKGEKGETGQQGPQGEKGQDGQPGVQGSQGEKGERGEKGETGSQGPAGAQGPKGDGADVEPATIVIDEQMPQNPKPNAVYMIQKPISIIPSVSLIPVISNNELSVTVLLYDLLENKIYGLLDYATHINKTVSLDIESNDIYVIFDGKYAFQFHFNGFTIDTSNVSLTGIGIIEAPVLTQTTNMSIRCKYDAEFWMPGSRYNVTFDLFGPVKYDLN